MMTTTTTFKVYLLGDPKAGKTAVLRRMAHGEFHKDYNETKENNFSKVSKTGNDAVQLQVWDISERRGVDSKIYSEHLKDADYCVIVFDINAENCLESIKQWIQIIKEAQKERKIPIMLMRTKIDSDDQNKIKDDPEKQAQLRKIEDIYTLNGYIYVENSAKEDKYIQEDIEAITTELWETRHQSLEFIRKEKLEKVSKEIEKLSNKKFFLGRPPIYTDTIQNLMVLQTILTESPINLSTKKLLDEWGGAKIMLSGSKEEISRYQLMERHQNLFSRLFHNDAGITSSKQLSLLRKS